MRTKDVGFTLLELILIILIIGILSVSVFPKWGASSFLLEYEANHVLDDIRYAQALSLGTGQRYRWVKTSSSTYQITNESGTAIILPNGSTTATLKNGVTFGAFTNLPNNLIVFDAAGVPYTTTAFPGTALAASATVAMSSGSDSGSVVIIPTTGFGMVQ